MSHNNFNNCACCGGGSLLRHIRSRQIYWYCTNCRQEVPSLTSSELIKADVIDINSLEKQVQGLSPEGASHSSFNSQIPPLLTA
jgi:hypothetical protein